MNRLLLQTLRDAALSVAKEHNLEWRSSPLEGCCATVALMVQAIEGGDLMTGLVRGTRHYWNRLPDGKEVDLTSCQFGGDGFTPLSKGRKVRKPELLDPRLLGFAAAVLQHLKG